MVMETMDLVELFSKFIKKKEEDLITFDELKQINRVLESIINSSYDAICVNDRHARGVFSNDAYSKEVGVQWEEFIGKSLYDLIEKGFISDSAATNVLKDKCVKTIIQRVNGKELLVTGTPVFDEDGEISHVVSNVRDISDLNKLKAELYETKVLSKKYLQEIRDLRRKEGARLLTEGVIAQSKEIIDVIHMTKKVSKVDSAVLLLGESGVGKEVFANMIHGNSKRSDGPYIKVNCAAIPENLLESELFGYEKGAFTGANQKGKLGYFEQAEGGTIFLDEIGEMPLDLQVKLLRVLQEYEIMRVGGTKRIKVDVRIISATNRSLSELVEKGEFRKDLYYRLNIVPIEIPPLRNRKADIPPLAYFFLNNMNEKYNMKIRIQPEVIHCFEEYDWPGNIREMENLIERLVVISDSDEITLDHLPETFFSEGTPVKKLTLKEIVNKVEKKAIKEAMFEYGTTRKAARKLGISQSALVKKMQKLEINEY